MSYLKSVLLSILLLLSGCQAMIYGTSADFQNISLGMTKEQVISVLGSPVSTEADADKGEEQLVYKRMKHAISEWPRSYVVVFRNGRVVKYGEQYKEQNLSVF